MNAESEQLKRNSPFWAGVLLVLLAMLSFALFFVSVPGQRFLPWANVLLSGMAVVLFVMGLRRARSHPERYRGKAAVFVLTIVSSLVFLFAIVASYAARKVPDANAAPQVGQKAPDFELKDTNGQTVSLAELLADPLDGAGKGPRPKAVLLVFYRGYW
jgi:hypothetical protein